MEDGYLEKTVASTFGNQPLDLPMRPYLAQPEKTTIPARKHAPVTLNYRWENKGDRLGKENWINKPLREQGRRQPCKRIQFFSNGTLFASMLLFNIHFLCK